jgi:hypothetical protein
MGTEKHIDLRIQGTIRDSEAVDDVVRAVSEFEEPEKKPGFLRRLWSFFWDLSWKMKIATLVIIGTLLYGAYGAYQAKSIAGAQRAFAPITNVVKSIWGVVVEVIKDPSSVITDEIQ